MAKAYLTARLTSRAGMLEYKNTPVSVIVTRYCGVEWVSING